MTGGTGTPGAQQNTERLEAMTSASATNFWPGARAAEARVEAAEPVIEAARAVTRALDKGRTVVPGDALHRSLWTAIDSPALARAALACPPQQPPAWPGAGPDERDYSVETP